MIINPKKIRLPSLLCSALLFVACGNEVEPKTSVIPVVKFFEVGEEAGRASRRISGRLVAADTSPLSFSVGGTVEEVLVNRGDVVERGQLLALLDIEPLRNALEQARANLAISRAKATEAGQNYERVLSLFKKKVVSQAELDSATAAYATARGSLKAAKGDLESKQLNYSHAELKAPFSGAIAQRSVDPFQEVGAGNVAFVLQSAKALKVAVGIPETLIREIDFGQSVLVNLPTIKGVNLNGVVAEIGSRTESGNSFPVSIQLSPSELELYPGMTASVILDFDNTKKNQASYIIPLSSIAVEFGMIRKERGTDSQGDAVPVFVINDDSILEIRDILVGDLRGNYLEVFEGLKPGDKIVSAGVSFLREGMPVELWTPEQGLNDE